MDDYGYKVTMRNEDCGVVRAVAFHFPKQLRWYEAEKEAYKHMTSQTCIRCGENHRSDDFYAERIEVDDVRLH